MCVVCTASTSEELIKILHQAPSKRDTCRALHLCAK